MSVVKFKEDYKFWVDKERDIGEMLEQKGYIIWEAHKTTDIHDISFSKWKNLYSWEIKSRRNTKDQYEDTMIGANKLEEAWWRYYKEWVETIFFFIFTDWIYFLRPFECIPRIEYKAGRWDRGAIDRKKGWAYFATASLINIMDI